MVVGRRRVDRGPPAHRLPRLVARVVVHETLDARHFAATRRQVQRGAALLVLHLGVRKEFEQEVQRFSVAVVCLGGGRVGN